MSELDESIAMWRDIVDCLNGDKPWPEVKAFTYEQIRSVLERVAVEWASGDMAAMPDTIELCSPAEMALKLPGNHFK